MAILHVENRDDTRSVLADHLGAKGGVVDGLAYVSTSLFGAAEARLRSGTVRALVLDLGLNPEWDNRNLSRALRQLALGKKPLDHQEVQDFYAYRLAHLAQSLGVPCSLLTNFPEYLGLEGPQLEALRDAFHAEAVFRKDEYGIAACACWVRQEFGLDLRGSGIRLNNPE
jgi:hypothetical protein